MKLCSKLLILFIALTGTLSAQDIPEPMSPPRLVNDFAKTFTSSQADDLEQMLRAYNDSTSTQIYVVTITDLEGYAASDYAYRLGQKWGVGQKSKNNGAVILIKPKIGNSRGDVYIAVGYGLEPILNDARIGRIIDAYMIPYFQENNYYGGTKGAIEAIQKYLSGEFEADRAEENAEIFFGVLLVIFVIIIIIIAVKNNKNNGDSGSSSGGGFFPPIFPGSFGSGGGRSSGGFGGGGGGSFGGGGAGRSW